MKNKNLNSSDNTVVVINKLMQLKNILRELDICRVRYYITMIFMSFFIASIVLLLCSFTFSNSASARTISTLFSVFLFIFLVFVCLIASDLNRGVNETERKIIVIDLISEYNPIDKESYSSLAKIIYEDSFVPGKNGRLFAEHGIIRKWILEEKKRAVIEMKESLISKLEKSKENLIGKIR